MHLAAPKRRVRRIVLAVLLLVLGGGATLWLVLGGTDAVLRTTPLASPDAVGPLAMDEHAGRALVGCVARPTLSLIDTHTGALLKTVGLGSGWCRAVTVAVAVGCTFVLQTALTNAGSSDNVSMLETRTGMLLRILKVPLVPTASAVDEQGGHVFVASEGLQKGSGNTLGAGVLSVLDARTGTLIRRVPLGVHPVAVAVDDKTRRVFVVNGGQVGPTGLGVGTITVLDADTGDVKRTVMVGRGAGAIAVDEKTARVFVTCEDSHSVSVLDARTGAVLKTIGVGFPRAVAVDEKAGRVVVANAAPATVSLLDATSGAVLHTLEVGGAPDGVAIDARTSRAFVTGTGRNDALYRQLRSSGLFKALPYDAGYVTVLDTGSGRILHTVHVGLSGEKGAAVDGHTGHAFITDITSNSVDMLDARP